MTNATEQAIIVTTQEEINPSQSVTLLALFDIDGAPLDLSGEGGGDSYTDSAARAAIATKTQVAALTAVSVANAEEADGETPTDDEFNALVALANANKAALNAIIAALKA